MAEYAAWLGLDPAADGDLLWIAREGLKAPLPEEWRPCRNDAGELFYVSASARWNLCPDPAFGVGQGA